MTFNKRKLLNSCFIFTLLAMVSNSMVFAQNNPLSQSEGTDLKEKVDAALRKGVAFFHSVNTQGGYVYFVTPDLTLKWGEVPLDDNAIEVQPPGTPAVGQSFLRAYQVTGDKQALEFAKEAAYALIRGQTKSGGWDHTINFKKLDKDVVSFDDNQTQSAVSFLMALDQEIDDPLISSATQRALKMMIHTQLSNGGWPHRYPERGDYHDYATFNDGGINDCIRVMIEAYQYYPNDEAIEKSLRKAARFMNISQLPPPQPGWAQQYNEFLQPAWARTFEPPAVCPLVTVHNINTLIDLYLALGHKTLLEPIPDALRWLKEIRMENGMWARFVEIGTGKPLYYDRPRIRVDNLEDLHPERRTGYGYQTDLQARLEASTARYDKAMTLGYKDLLKGQEGLQTKEVVAKRLEEISSKVIQIIDEQEKSGAWITKNDTFKKRMPSGVRWNGQYLTMDRISSEVFNNHISLLTTYIELSNQLNKFE
ncbi:pectate lyase [Cyclobacterium sp. 1_MG-2023]|uniref:pectate lyase n=1 Tax=Cyclobacterium sp. 1_MG-2023 TaxID=3062681 RepID=UPI0026E12B75|nr:pectate lyase [Cyclobacterium sp. 1_MG-2023]MDO6435796.1 pectate lyase [Cyclobacterium sp. 1_MG-2023]